MKCCRHCACPLVCLVGDRRSVCVRCREGIRSVSFLAFIRPDEYARIKNRLDYMARREEILENRRAYYRTHRETVKLRVREYRRKQKETNAEH